MDLIMGRFADDTIETLTEPEIAELERLMDVPDPQLLAWMTGQEAVPPDYDGPVLRRIRDFNLHGGVVR
jgi:antitoxin CptB